MSYFNPGRIRVAESRISTRVSIPAFGIWSNGDVALAEDQMIGSAAFVDAPWRCERLEGVSHWVPVDVPDKLSELILDFYK